MPWQRLWVLLHQGTKSERGEEMKKTAEAVPVADHEALFADFATAIEGHLRTRMDEVRVREIAEEVAANRLPRTVEVRLSDGRTHLIEGRVHKQFDALVELVNEGHRNILMVGPAGCGKTTLAKNVAEALGLPFGFLSLSAGVTETHILGRILPQADGSWQYVSSRFVEVYENGGVFLLDELDAADANVLVAVNAALANGVLANPVNGQMHQRHPQCYILAAANTWGQGGDLMYVGRNQLDAATMDRFILTTVLIEYDATLEHDIATAALGVGEQAAELLQWVGNLRSGIRQNRLRRVASTRLVAHATAAMKAGTSLEAVKTRYFQNWSEDERSKAAEAA